MMILDIDIRCLKFILIIFCCHFLLSGKTKPIRGTILNEDGEKISDVNVVSLPSGQGTKSNSDGVFYLQTPIKDRELSLDHIGYESVVLNIILFEQL